MEKEKRVIHMEIRAAAADDGQRRLEGYPAVFNSLSEDLGGFREQIRPGAFRRTLDEQDVRALWNHDSNYPLGRTSNGTLRLAEDQTGLRMALDLPDTSYARDLWASVQRGDVDGMSFMFTVAKEEWSKRDGQQLRELIDLDLYEVSPVTFPAYEATSVSARALEMAAATEHPAEAGGDEAQGTEPQGRPALKRAQVKVAKSKLENDQ